MNRYIKILLIFLFLSSSACGQELFEKIDDRTAPVLNDELKDIRRRIPKTRVLSFFIPGDAAVDTNMSARLDVPFAGEIVKATAYAKTAPVGSAIIFDINKNGTTIWGNQTNRLTIADGASTGSTTSFTTKSVYENDYFTVDIDAIGSGTAGADITVQLQIKEAR